MNKMQAGYLLAAVFTFLAVIAMMFFAKTASKNNIAFVAVAVFFALSDAFWIYQFVNFSLR